MRLFVFVSVLCSAQALAELPVLKSRHTMPSCAFVYRVDTDIRIRADEWGGKSIRINFQNHWSDSAEREFSIVLSLQPEGLIEFQTETMSIARDFLYRQMSFSFGQETKSGEFVSQSPVYQSEIGRQFGEHCRLTGDEDAPFVERIVEISEP